MLNAIINDPKPTPSLRSVPAKCNRCQDSICYAAQFSTGGTTVSIYFVICHDKTVYRFCVCMRVCAHVCERVIIPVLCVCVCVCVHVCMHTCASMRVCDTEQSYVTGCCGHLAAVDQSLCPVCCLYRTFRYNSGVVRSPGSQMWKQSCSLGSRKEMG